jgi:hypothetical protein
MNKEFEKKWKNAAVACMYICASSARSNWRETTAVGNFNSLLPDLEMNPGLSGYEAQF